MNKQRKATSQMDVSFHMDFSKAMEINRTGLVFGRICTIISFPFICLEISKARFVFLLEVDVQCFH